MENSARYQGPEPQRLLSMQQVLHYEVRVDGVPIDPMLYLASNM